MSKVLLYTFYTPRLICYKIAQSIDSENLSKLYLGSANALVKNMLNHEYDNILGLGNYHKGSKNIRIETLFKNAHGKREIVANGSEYRYSNWEIEPKERVVISKTITNGPCNRSAYLVANTIQVHHLNTKFAFLHIPKSFGYAEAEEVVINYLDTLRV